MSAVSRRTNVNRNSIGSNLGGANLHRRRFPFGPSQHPPWGQKRKESCFSSEPLLLRERHRKKHFLYGEKASFEFDEPRFHLST